MPTNPWFSGHVSCFRTLQFFMDLTIKLGFIYCWMFSYKSIKDGQVCGQLQWSSHLNYVTLL